MKEYDFSHCMLCPRSCGTDRQRGSLGFCKSGVLTKVSLASVHGFEEPSISGSRGSGTVFFSGCNMGCVFCQNHNISSGDVGLELSNEELSGLFLKQQQKKVHNLNLVSGGHFIPQLVKALKYAKKNGLTIPVVYNTNAYEKVESLALLEGLVDVYLPDLKYFDNSYSISFSATPNYFETAISAILEMVRQTGKNQFDKDGIMTKGTLVRHLVLPGLKEDSKKVLEWIAKNLGDDVYISLMSQYTPMYLSSQYPQLNRRLTSFEYQRVLEHFFHLGLKNGYMQKKTSANACYTPNFDLSGLE